MHRSYNWAKGKSKNRRFLAAFFSIFLSLLKEIWPPEAEKQDAGAARNRRTENGPSGTPAPTRVRPETWRDKCGRGVPIGGVQTRDAGAGGVFRRTVIDRCGPSGRRIQNYVGCKALPLYGAGEESFRAVRRSGSGDGSTSDSLRIFLHRSYNWTKGKSKNHGSLAAFFSIFLSLLKEIWPPEA